MTSGVNNKRTPKGVRLFRSGCGLNSPPAGEQVEDQDDDCQNQNDVDEPSTDVQAKAEQTKNE